MDTSKINQSKKSIDILYKTKGKTQIKDMDFFVEKYHAMIF